MQEHYGHLHPPSSRRRTSQPEPPQTEERRARVEKPTPTHKVAIGYKGPALGDFDYAPLVLLNEILFGGRSSRVHRALVQEQEIASEVRGWVGSFRDPALYDIFLSARGGHTDRRAARGARPAARAVRREPPSQGELDRVKARVELGTLQGLETVSGKAEQIGFYETVLGDPAALFDKLAAYRRVTASRSLCAWRAATSTTRARTVIEVIPDGLDDGADDGEETPSRRTGELADRPRPRRRSFEPSDALPIVSVGDQLPLRLGPRPAGQGGACPGHGAHVPSRRASATPSRQIEETIDALGGDLAADARHERLHGALRGHPPLARAHGGAGLDAARSSDVR